MLDLCPILAHFAPAKLVEFHTDALAVSVGATLIQVTDGMEEVVAHAGKALQCSTEKL